MKVTQKIKLGRDEKSLKNPDVEALFERLRETNLVLNLEKCEFVRARVQYLGYVVGQGEETPPEAKVEARRSGGSPRRPVARACGDFWESLGITDGLCRDIPLCWRL